MTDSSMQVLQIPEVCTWNPYIELSERGLAGRGVRVQRPGLCMDGPFSVPPSPPEADPDPDVIHVHWPEILADWYGVDAALELLRKYKRHGATVVQTVHDLQPHPFESTPELLAFLDEVDALTDGAHFFSAEHEQVARSGRARLPAATLHLLHPAFGVTPADRSRPKGDNDDVVIGCFGRVRPDKRYVQFAEAFGAIAGPGFRLLIAGAPLDDEIDRALRRVADAHPSVTYRAGFHSHDEFTEMVRDVDWVALPYERVYSSGVLINAIEASKPVLGRAPTGVDAYHLRPGLLVVEPWDHSSAVRRWTDVARDPQWRTSPEVLPDWHEAAGQLIGFYSDLRRRSGDL